MPVKDYYSILKVEPKASPAEIKKAYRRLALQLHPDRNTVSSSDQRFHEITEAYEILSNEQRREAYNYERWLVRQTGQRFAAVVDTPDELLIRVKELRTYVEALDPFRTNFNGIVLLALNLINDGAVNMLSEWSQPEKLRVLLENMILIAAKMPAKPAGSLLDRLSEIAGNNQELLHIIQQQRLDRRYNDRWEKLRVPILLLVTIIICVLIFLLSR